MSLHRDNKLDSLIGKVVEVTLYDNTVIKGVLGFTEEFSAKYDYKKPYYYTCDSWSFRKTFVKKIKQAESGGVNMADIELVIKIPEGLKKDFESEQWTALSCMEMKDALMNGTPLPKQHGRLIDADDLLDNTCLDQIPTIIEADKVESEG